MRSKGGAQEVYIVRRDGARREERGVKGRREEVCLIEETSLPVWLFEVRSAKSKVAQAKGVASQSRSSQVVENNGLCQATKPVVARPSRSQVVLSGAC
jgi:hypothetical protein